MTQERQTWASRATFILAAVGSAVGLGNAWRFPGLAAKYGGGAFLLVYVIAMLVLGVPLLAMEVSIGRKMKQGAIGSMRALNKKAEPIGWLATCNAFAITTYYATVFAWVLVMLLFSWKFAGFTGIEGGADMAAGLFGELTQTTWTSATAFSDWDFPFIVFLLLVVCWIIIYLCLRKGTVSVGKVVKYTGLTLPLAFLGILAIRGLTLPNAGKGLAALFVPNFAAVVENGLVWSMIVDAIGQVFFSLSIMMAIMFAYGSYLPEDINVATSSITIALCDLGVSVISGIVMFTTMYGLGMEGNFSTSGIATAFIIYPQAIVSLTNVGWINAIFGAVFYLCLASLAIDSAFSIVEGVSTAIADRYKLDNHKTTKVVILVAAVISLLYVSKCGLARLDIIDNFTNQYGMILAGALECFVVGWLFKTEKVLAEVNRNTTKYKMPKWWFYGSIKFIAPVVLLGFCTLNLINLFKTTGGIYGVGDGYSLLANIAFGWGVLALSLASGYIANGVVALKKKKGYVDPGVPEWDDM